MVRGSAIPYLSGRLLTEEGDSEDVISDREDGLYKDLTKKKISKALYWMRNLSPMTAALIGTGGMLP